MTDRQGQNDRETDRQKSTIKSQLITAGIVIFTACCIIMFYFCVKRYDGLRAGWDTLMTILQPIIIGAVMAFMMNPIMQFLERRFYPFVLKHSKSEQSAKKTSRMVCAILSLVIFAGVIILIFVAVIPELYGTVRFLVDNLGNQISGILDWANEITLGHFEKNIMSVKNSGIEEMLQNALAWIGNYLDVGQAELISGITTGVMGVGKFFMNLFVGVIVSIYILVSKETFKGQTKKIIYGTLKVEYANVVLDVIRKANEVFYGFIIGKIIDSLIVGVICYVAMTILRMPYVLLVSVIIGLTNIIPVFGPFIGGIPSVIIIFLTSPMQGIYFLILVVVLQQVDGNIIGPKILGNSTGLSSFWVVFAIVLGGGLFGFPGMLLGVPTMAVIYYLAQRLTRWLLRRKGLPEDTETYVHMKQVDAGTGELIMKTPEEEEKSRFTFSGKNKKNKETKQQSSKEDQE